MGSHERRRAIGPAVAGTWYPAGAEELRGEVDRYLAGPGETPRGRILGLIEPHAGYVYSGAVAGRGFALVRGGAYSRVILLGPSHYHGFRGAALPEAEIYRTPLGEVGLDTVAIDALAGRSGFRRFTEAFSREHSLESEIPFLQRALEPAWKLIPILIGARTSGAAAQEIADALRPWRDDRTLVVASTDFTHFGPRFGYEPFRDRIEEGLRELDMGAVREVESGDPERFEAYVATTGATICGRDAVDIVMRLMPGDARAALVAYDTSGRITGDWTHSVSYAALAYSAP
ncbi:MAG: AmmeMemoRadiSam system protein B [Acidobacteriota bacterium]|nr:AmmeMemoRadiSam system protein B [Acidobacteriota bacterium]